MIKDIIFPRLKDYSNKNKKEILEAVFKYIDRNNELLNTAIIHEGTVFTIDDKEIAYRNCRTSEEELKTLIKNSETFSNKQAKTKLKAQEFAVCTTLLASHFLNSGDKEACKYIILYRCFDLYSYIHGKYVRYGAKENVMAYTVANMSGSFGLKKLGSILALIEDTVVTLIKTYEKQLKRCNDDDIEYFCTATFTRLNIKMRKIFNQYYKNHNAGTYLNLDTENNDPNNFQVANSDTKVISSLIDKVYNDFISNTISREIDSIAVLGTDISPSKLIDVLNDIRNDKDVLQIRYVIGNIIAYAVNYSNLSPYDINTGKFIEICKKGYASNTISSEMDSVKKIIELFVNKASTKHGRQRYGKTAMNNYKKALFMYFVYAIYTDAR